MKTAPGTRRIRLHRWFATKTYVLGLSSGTMSGWSHDSAESAIFWRGKRVYFLGWPRWKWRCLLKFHHWPGPELVAFGFCGKCVPWPCCGSTERDHRPGCEDGAA